MGMKELFRWRVLGWSILVWYCLLALWVLLSGIPVGLRTMLAAMLLSPLIIFGVFIPGFLENMGINVMADCGPELCFDVNALGVSLVSLIFLGSIVLVYAIVWYFIIMLNKKI